PGSARSRWRRIHRAETPVRRAPTAVRRAAPALRWPAVPPAAAVPTRRQRAGPRARRVRAPSGAAPARWPALAARRFGTAGSRRLAGPTRRTAGLRGDDPAGHLGPTHDGAVA